MPSENANPELPTAVCPTADDVRASIDNCQLLIDDAGGIIHRAREYGPRKEAHDLNAEIEFWWQQESRWKDTRQELASGKQLLLGADGTVVHPELPLALENLSYAGKWLECSVKAAQQGKVALAEKYVRGARLAIHCAAQVLDGKVPANRRKAIVKIPGYLKMAGEPASVSESK